MSNGLIPYGFEYQGTALDFTSEDVLSRFKNNGSGWLEFDGIHIEAEEFISEFTIHYLDFCGCGQPNEAYNFYVEQLRAISEKQPFDYFGIIGGIDFFKTVAVCQGVITPDTHELTVKGTMVLRVMGIALEALKEGLSLVGETMGSLIQFPSDCYNAEQMELSKIIGNPTRSDYLNSSWSILLQNFNVNEIPQNISTLNAMWYLHLGLNILEFKHCFQGMLPWDKYYPIMHQKLIATYEKNTGAYYWTWYMIDNVLQFETHGGSSPGWLTDEGRNMLGTTWKVFIDTKLKTLPDLAQDEPLVFSQKEFDNSDVGPILNLLEYRKKLFQKEITG